MDERMDAPNGKRIVELLRKAAVGGYEGGRGRVMDNLAQLIDCDGDMHFHTIGKLADMVEEAIQHEHETAYDEGWDAGFASADDWCAQHEDAMAEHGWVRLPKDADGEVIHVGDVMEWVRYKDDDPTIVRTVSGIGNGVFFAWSDEQGRYAQYEAHAYRHHHAPTVEDVLRDMHAKLDEVTALYVGEAIDSDERDSDEARIFAEYAAKLQLREDA